MTGPRRILITGSTRGLGRFLAEHLLAEGAQVVGCGRGASAISHDRYVHVQADVTDESAVTEMLQEVRRRLQGLDVLINNAGIGSMSPLALTPTDTARRIVEVNFLGTYLVTRGALRLLKKSDAGRIVNFTSIAVPLRLAGETAYAAAKAAVEALTRILAKECGPLGVTCNAVGPSPIRTDLIRGVPEEKLQALVNQQAIHDWAAPEDVANVVDFFLRPQSRLITGQIVYLGGFS